MKIGLSVNYKKIEDVLSIIEESKIDIKHLQINGLPADIDEIRDDLIDDINRIRSSFPTMELSFHAYPYNFTEAVTEVRDVWLTLAKKMILLANECNVRFVNFHAGYGVDATSRKKHDGYRELVVSAVEELLTTSSAFSSEIHMENTYPESRGSDFTKLGDRLSDFKYFFDEISNPLFKLCYDYGHGNLDENGINILREYSYRLGSLHVHDNDQVADIHWPIGQKGMGTIDWEHELEYLKKIKFKESFILESYTEHLKKSLTYLMSLDDK